MAAGRRIDQSLAPVRAARNSLRQQRRQLTVLSCPRTKESIMNKSAVRAVVLGGHGVAVAPHRANEQAAWIGIYANEASLLVRHIECSVKLAKELGAHLVLSGG